jgi:hypothetical protein
MADAHPQLLLGLFALQSGPFNPGQLPAPRFVAVDGSLGCPISDDAAIAFAASFYRALAFGRRVGQAFSLGMNEVELHRISQDGTPKLFTTRMGVNASDLILVAREISTQVD